MVMVPVRLVSVLSSRTSLPSWGCCSGTVTVTVTVKSRIPLMVVNVEIAESKSSFLGRIVSDTQRKHRNRGYRWMWREWVIVVLTAM
jgi:hypothetical protein